jgi:hypothetical protein
MIKVDVKKRQSVQRSKLSRFAVYIVMSLLLFNIYGCGPNTEKIMKQYEGYRMVESSNQAGISISVKSFFEKSFIVNIEYSNPILNADQRLLELLSTRFIIANAVNPTDIITTEVKIGSRSQTTYNNDGTVRSSGNFYNSIMQLRDLKTKFILVGFKGISKSESEELETPPLFFLVKIDKEQCEVLTPKPRMANDIFDTDHENYRFPVYIGVLKSERKNSLGFREDHVYSIRIGETGKDDKGNIYVDFFSEDIKAENWIVTTDKDDYWHHETLGYINIKSPFSTEIIAGKKTFLSIAFNLPPNGGAIREFYNAEELPDTIIIRANITEFIDNKSISFGETLMFDGKTKEVIKRN